MLSKVVRVAAETHAGQVAPNECCGLVIVEQGRQRYVPCRNAAESGGYFVIPARDYAGAEDRGEIISVVHSHPNNNVEPSDADLEACMASGLPWWIVSWPGGMWHRIDPRSAPDVLAGHAFKWGERDCAAIVAEWYRREAGIELPPFPRESITSFSCMAFVAYVEHAGFEFIPLESDRKAGDVVLMQLRGDGPDHLGVIDDSGRLVHHLAGRLSSLDAYVGLWLSATTAVLRRMI